MAEEYISKNEILDHIKDVYEQAFISLEARQMVSAFKAYVSNLPTADVVEIKHGYWKRPTLIGGLKTNLPHCSVCGKVPCDEGNYCPECGTKMDGRRDT